MERQLLTEDEFYKAQDEYGMTASPPRSAPKPSAACWPQSTWKSCATKIRGDVAEVPGGEKAEEAGQSG